MKANAPEKIYIQPDAHDGWFEGNPHSNIFVEYTRTDVFIEKVCEWIKMMWSETNETFKEDYTGMLIENFRKYMEGE
jgi:hypothetical protein